MERLSTTFAAAAMVRRSTRVAFAGGQPDSITPAEWVIGISPDGRHIAFLFGHCSQTHRAIQIATTRRARGRPNFDGQLRSMTMLYGFSRSGTRRADRVSSPRSLQRSKPISLADGQTRAVSPLPISYLDEPAVLALGLESGVSSARSMARDQFVVYDVASKRRRALDAPPLQPEPPGMAVVPERIAHRVSLQSA